jgi:hypothetical protein
MTKDYTITMQDSTGRIHEVCVNGASIDEQLANGASLTEATEGVENNSVEVAMRQGLIGTDAWLI